MIDLSKVELTAGIMVDGEFFPIKTDFRQWLGFSSLLENENSKLYEADYLYVDKKPADRKKGFEKLFEFYNPPQILPRPSGNETHTKVLDYFIDADLIYAAFMEVYKIDLLQTDSKGKIIELHWHKFLALLNGLHGTKLNDVMGYRCYNQNDKTEYKEQMIQLKRQWELPSKQTEEDEKALEEFNKLFE